MNAADDSSPTHALGTPSLAEAIDRRPLTVTPDVPLLSVITMMCETAKRRDSSKDSSRNSSKDSSKNPSRNSSLAPQNTLSPDPLQGARSSCVLIMQNGNLLGIFTERDLVQCTALGRDLRTPIREVMHHPVLTMSERSLHSVFAALFLFRRHRIRHLVITTEDQQLVGVVSLDSIRHVLRPANLLKIRRVAEVMTHHVVTASANISVLQLAELMAIQQISCVVIVESAVRSPESDSVADRLDGLSDELSDELSNELSEPVENATLHPVGIVTERDIVRFQALGLDLNKTQAKAVMSAPLFVLSPEDSLWTAHQAMEQQQVRRLVVSWNWGKNLAIVTQTSILRVFDPIEMHGVIETLQRTIQQFGLDLGKVLANAIDHDSHLPPAMPSIDREEPPNLKTFLHRLQNRLADLANHPELPVDRRQALLQTLLSDLQQFQDSL